MKGAEEKKQNVIPDQIALPSKRDLQKDIEKPGEIYENLNKTSTERVTVHYENSNGFMPIVVLDHRRKNVVTKPKETQKKSESVLENDPVYSLEARMFLNLPLSGANRRNFDSGDRRSDLELLKVDSNTPAIANYQEFYENVQSVINQNQDPADIGKKKVSRARGKFGNKQMQNVDISDSGGSYNRHFPANSYNSNQFKSNYDTEKVNSNHHQQDMSVYNFQRNVASKEKPVPRTHTRLTSGIEKKSKSEVHKLHAEEWNNKNHLTDVEDDEPSNYSLEQQTQRSTISSVSGDSISNIPNSSPNIYVQENFNMGTSRHYERSEDSQGISDEDYVDVTEKPRRIHKSRRRPQTAELSRKLPKEHRYSQDSDDRKRQNLSRAKQRHRQRNKNHYDDDGRYQMDESHEEKLESSESDTNMDTNSWSQVGSNLEVSHSNGYQVDQIEKPKLLVPVNLVPFTQFDHQNALGSSQGFDVNNAMIQNLGGGMIISTAPPFSSTPQSMLKNGPSSKVPDIIMGQSSMQNPVSVLLPQSPTPRSASTTTPRSIFASASTIAPTYQQIALNHLPANILLPQQSLQTVSNLIPNSDIQIQPHGIQGQNIVSLQNIPIVSSTTPISQKLSTDGHYLATASLAVGDAQKSNQKTIYQTQMVPALLHTGVINLNHQNQDSFVVARPKDNAQIQKATNDAFLSSMKDLQMQIQRNQLNSYQGTSNQGANLDSIGSASNNINTMNSFAGIPISIIRTQLPVMGSKNVEIINPHIKPSPIDFTILNPVTPVNQYAAMYTTPVPVISTGFMTSRPVAATAGDNVHLSNYVDSLTEYGAKSPPSSLFNFVPDDSLKAQSNKNSRGSSKSNLKSEIAKYAEEMVRESFKTMYNSQKLNNDRRVPGNISLVDSSELAKLRNELLRLKPTGSDSKSPKDVLEAHQTENKIRTSNSRPSKNHSQKPAFSMEQIEHILKDDMNFYTDYYGKQEFEDGKNYKINDYLTPPKPNSFLSKSPFHDKPVKKRPGQRPPGHSRSRPRKPGGWNSKPHGLETAASNNYEFGFDPPRFRNRPHFDYEYHDYRPGRHSKYRQKNRAFNNFSTYSSSLMENEQKALGKDLYDINNPRFHNLLGYLMKNKRLPNGIPQNYLSSRDNDNFVKILEVEKQRIDNQFYNDALQGLQKKYDESRLVHNTSQDNPKF